MDPIAHTFTGAALAAAGLRHTTPLATAALLIGANAPDVDVVTAYAGEYAALALRRGWTHGVLALVVLPLLITAVLLAWDRLRRRPGKVPVRAGPLLALAALGTLTHPVLDWLNNYGMRWLMPFDGRWSYGDALFIVDPWMWLVLGGVLFLAGSRRMLALSAWTVFWLIATWLMWTTPIVPMPSRVAWTAGVFALLVLRFKAASAPDPARSERWAQSALACVTAYMAAALAASFVARAQVRTEAGRHGIGPVTDVMVGPAAANPFAGTVVIATASEYHVGTWHWLSDPRLAFDAAPIDRRLGDPLVAAASLAPDARRYLAWSRFPYFEVEDRADGHVVRVRDARYHGTGRLSGPDVWLDLDLRPLPITESRHTAH